MLHVHEAAVPTSNSLAGSFTGREGSEISGWRLSTGLPELLLGLLLALVGPLEIDDQLQPKDPTMEQPPPAVLRISDPADRAQIVPYFVGFTPGDSLVVVATQNGRIRECRFSGVSRFCRFGQRRGR